MNSWTIDSFGAMPYKFTYHKAKEFSYVLARIINSKCMHPLSALALLHIITQSTQPMIMLNLPLSEATPQSSHPLRLMPQITFFYCESQIPRLVTSESHRLTLNL